MIFHSSMFRFVFCFLAVLAQPSPAAEILQIPFKRNKAIEAFLQAQKFPVSADVETFQKLGLAATSGREFRNPQANLNSPDWQCEPELKGQFVSAVESDKIPVENFTDSYQLGYIKKQIIPKSDSANFDVANGYRNLIARFGEPDRNVFEYVRPMGTLSRIHTHFGIEYQLRYLTSMVTARFYFNDTGCLVVSTFNHERIVRAAAERARANDDANRRLEKALK